MKLLWGECHLQRDIILLYTNMDPLSKEKWSLWCFYSTPELKVQFWDLRSVTLLYCMWQRWKVPSSGYWPHNSSLYTHVRLQCDEAGGRLMKCRGWRPVTLCLRAVPCCSRRSSSWTSAVFWTAGVTSDQTDAKAYSQLWPGPTMPLSTLLSTNGSESVWLTECVCVTVFPTLTFTIPFTDKQKHNVKLNMFGHAASMIRHIFHSPSTLPLESCTLSLR